MDAKRESLQMLLQGGCPAIRYRTRRDLLAQPARLPDMQALRAEVLKDAQVREMLGCQQPDGWLGGRFHGTNHGTNEPETGIRLLMEKGVEPDHPAAWAALDAILKRGDAFDKGTLQRVGKPLDAFLLGGSAMIRACVFAYAGREAEPFMRPQMQAALHAFADALKAKDATDLYRLHKGIPVFREGMAWPGIYALRLLAFTKGWRTPENMRLVAQSLRHMAALAPIPRIRLLHRGQVIGPGQIDFINVLVKAPENLTAGEWMPWLYGMELASRLGVAQDVPFLQTQLARLAGFIGPDGWTLAVPKAHPYFTKWTPYAGLSLEGSWRQKGARNRDLTFRALLALKHAGMLQL